MGRRSGVPERDMNGIRENVDRLELLFESLEKEYRMKSAGQLREPGQQVVSKHE
jgi:hypothetical protein